MKSETVVDVESVDSDLLYLLLQHIYSQNPGLRKNMLQTVDRADTI